MNTSTLVLVDKLNFSGLSLFLGNRGSGQIGIPGQ